MVRTIAAVDQDECEAHGENAFFVCDLAEVYRQNERWERALGRPGGHGRRVEAFFAVKCNPDPLVLRMLAALGLGFDCASQAEISTVLALGVAPSRIIYANPCKAASFIRHAAASGVDMMTFDNADELAKCRKHHPRAKLVLRLLTDDSGSVCRLGAKFGAHPSMVRPLLVRARELGLDVVGVSFHVGSGCTNPELFADALERARRAFDIGAELGYRFDLLDVGGGFQGETFETMAGVIQLALERYFPVDGAGAGVRVIAEPGRFYVTEAFELATNIIARRGLAVDGIDDADVAAEDKPITMYYINDGVYGAFNCTMFDHQVVRPVVLTLDGGDVILPASSTSDENAALRELALEMSPCSIWGPTCDSIDCVVARTDMPTGRLEVGDWIRWPQMGAYTICAASQFNGFRRSLVHYTIHAPAAVEERIRALLAA